MVDVFKERVKMIRGELTYEQFAKELTKSGLPFGKAIVWRYENEEGLAPGFAFYYAVARIFQINLNWLITGDGQMFTAEYYKKEDSKRKSKIKNKSVRK